MSTEATLALQKALRSRLNASSALKAIIPAGNIGLDSRRPEAMPCVLIGPANINFADDYDQFYHELFCDVHVWAADAGLTTVKSTAEVIRQIVQAGSWVVEDHQAISVKLASARYLRDPDGVHSHAVLTIEAILQATS